jgi:hypothetical protein
MKSKVMASIEEGRQLMGLDLFVRTAAGEVATEKNCSIIELYRKVCVRFSLCCLWKC